MPRSWAWLHRRRGPSAATVARIELWLGLGLMVAVALLGIVVIAHPGPLPVDRWAATTLHGAHLGVAAKVTELGSLPALIVGAAGCGLLALDRGVRRTIACLAGPMLASVSAELVLKPVIGRRLDGVLTYPSGTVVVVAALSTAATLAVRPRARLVVGAGGTLLTAMCALAVVAMRWHYGSDALAGAAWGVGVVACADALLRRRPKQLPGPGPAGEEAARQRQ